VVELFAEANASLPTATTKGDWVDYGPEALPRKWASISKEDLEAFRSNREKVHFLHGDLNDLVDRGPYDLVYLSNAWEYEGRNGTSYNIREAVRPGGFILLTTFDYKPAKVVGECELVFSERAKQGDSHGLNWLYNVYQVPERSH
jgi:hypothetical protein